MKACLENVSCDRLLQLLRDIVLRAVGDLPKKTLEIFLFCFVNLKLRNEIFVCSQWQGNRCDACSSDKMPKVSR
jgi:hypothetical protein